MSGTLAEPRCTVSQTSHFRKRERQPFSGIGIHSKFDWRDASVLSSFTNAFLGRVFILETHNPSIRIMRLSSYSSRVKTGRTIKDA